MIPLSQDFLNVCSLAQQARDRISLIDMSIAFALLAVAVQQP